MSTIELLETLVYLDLDFISSYYECESGHPLATQFTRQEGKKAGAQIPIFSAELSSVETKSYKISSIAMLEHVRKSLDRYPEISFPLADERKHTTYGWVNGKLSAAITTNSSSDRNGGKVVTVQERTFTLETPQTTVALITSETYFSSGWSAITRIQEILKDFSLSARTLVRILPSVTHVGHPVAVPLVILESRRDA